jgi:hypothetical protein
MRLSCNFVVNYANVNQFAYQNQWQMRAGDPVTLYFQLVDLDQAGLRYLAGIGMQNQPYSVVVTCPSIDDSKVLQFPATQVDPNDASLWQIIIAPTQIPSSGNVIFTVYEGTNTRRFNKMNALKVEIPGGDGGC